VRASSSPTTSLGTKRSKVERTRRRARISIAYASAMAPAVPSTSASSGTMRLTTEPALNASWAPTSSTASPSAAATSARKISRPGRPRRVASGATRPATIAISGSSHPGGSERGKPLSTVCAAAAWIWGPLISPGSEVRW
jgi:hypothetical protein